MLMQENRMIFDLAHANVMDSLKKMVVTDNNRREEIASWFENAYNNAQLEVQALKLGQASFEELSFIAQDIEVGLSKEAIRGQVIGEYLERGMITKMLIPSSAIVRNEDMVLAREGDIICDVKADLKAEELNDVKAEEANNLEFSVKETVDKKDYRRKKILLQSIKIQDACEVFVEVARLKVCDTKTKEKIKMPEDCKQKSLDDYQMCK